MGRHDGGRTPRGEGRPLRPGTGSPVTDPTPWRSAARPSAAPARAGPGDRAAGLGPADVRGRPALDQPGAHRRRDACRRPCSSSAAVPSALELGPGHGPLRRRGHDRRAGRTARRRRRARGVRAHHRGAAPRGSGRAHRGAHRAGRAVGADGCHGPPRRRDASIERGADARGDGAPQRPRRHSGWARSVSTRTPRASPSTAACGSRRACGPSAT